MTQNNANVDFKKLSELDVIKLIKNPETDNYTFNRACEFLLNKYEKMFHKHWWVLQKQMNNSALVNSIKDEYYSRAYEAFFKAIQKVDLSRLYDEKFKLMQLLSWYLTNVRTTLIRETIKKSKIKAVNAMSSVDNEEAISIDPDVEASYWNSEGYKTEPSYYVVDIQGGEDNCKRALKECFKKWTMKEQLIYKYLENGMPKVEIAKKLQVAPISIYNTVNKMKKELKQELGLEVC